MEAGVVVDALGRPIYWHRPRRRTAVSLPDSRALWDILFLNRHRLGGFAHTHPGVGVPAPSDEDLTTFSAVERGLGRRLDWWIASSDMLVVLRWCGPDEHGYRRSRCRHRPSWLAGLRALGSGGIADKEETR